VGEEDKKRLEEEKEMYAKMLADILIYPFLKWEAERFGFTGPDAVKNYLRWREEEDWRRNQFLGFYVSEGDQDYIERIVEGYVPEEWRGLDAVDAVLVEYGYDFADYQPHKGYFWVPEIKKWVCPPYPARDERKIRELGKYERTFPVHNYYVDRAIVKAVLLRRGWRFGAKGWEKGHRSSSETSTVTLEELKRELPIPEEHKDLFTKVVVGAYRGVEIRFPVLARSLPGGVLQLHPSIDVKRDLTSILHEYGHQVWYFVLNDQQRREFREIYAGQPMEACPTPEEGFAEGYAWYFSSEPLKEKLRSRYPEIFNFMERTFSPSIGEAERARGLALMRRRGVVEPDTWLDVSAAFQEHYRKVRDALVKAVGGYENIEWIREYPAEPFEAYYKIKLTLKNPVVAELKLIDNDVLEFNGQQLPLYIDEKAYTPYRLRLFKYFVEDHEKLQREIEQKKYVKITVKDFYVQVDNPAWYSRFEEKFVPRPGVFAFLIYE